MVEQCRDAASSKLFADGKLAMQELSKFLRIRIPGAPGGERSPKNDEDDIELEVSAGVGKGGVAAHS